MFETFEWYIDLFASLAKEDVCPTNFTGISALMASSQPASASYMAFRDLAMNAWESVAASHKSRNGKMIQNIFIINNATILD